MSLSSTKLLDLPEEVIVGLICPYLDLNDVLRLRRVSTALKSYSEMHLQVRPPKGNAEMQIDEITLPLFVGLKIQAARFYLNITSPQFFVKFEANIAKLLQICGDKMTHIHVAKFYAFTAPGEMAFYKSLHNLRHLVIDLLDSRRLSSAKLENGIRQPYSFPPNFKHLETLKIHGTIELVENAGFDYAHGAATREISVFFNNLYHWEWDLFELCEKLVDLKQTRYLDMTLDDLGRLTDAISLRKSKFPNGPNLQFFDISCASVLVPLDEIDFAIPFMETCVRHDVKLVNVDAHFFESLNIGFRDFMGDRAVSVTNMCAEMLSVQMPNLEKVTISTTSTFTLPVQWSNCHLDWPKLKTLDLTLDIDAQFVRHAQDNASALVTLIFERENPRREHLTDLTLSSKNLFGPIDSDVYVYPSAACIVATCPNLTKLTLDHYSQAPDAAFADLWEGLPLLEELSLEQCVELGDSGFLGKHVNSPSFLRLTRLKRLSLKNLDKMPKVTDTFFQLVLRHVKLTHLILGSEERIKTITMEGIESLLTGDFGKTIEKFPFQGWSLDGTNHEDFSTLAFKFRSSSLNYPFI